MSQPSKSNKRIVSKTEYVALKSKKASLTLLGSLLVGGSFVAFFCTVALSLTHWIWIIVVLLLFLLFWFGSKLLNEAEEIEDVIPLTPANTGDLLPADSLVRASSEPTEEQESVLLRASLQSQQTPTEQLLRPME